MLLDGARLLCVVCALLFVVWWLLFVVRCLLLFVCCLRLVVCSSVLVCFACCVLRVVCVCCLLHGDMVRGSLDVACDSLFLLAAVGCELFVVYRVLSACLCCVWSAVCYVLIDVCCLPVVVQ